MIEKHPSSCAIPITIGVTGHRDIPEEDGSTLRVLTSDFLRTQFRIKYPHSPILVLSALAEGADRIAAWAALDAGCNLGVYLPFPEEEYLLDFHSDESKSEFRSLLARADFVAVAREVPGVETDQRVRGYVAVGIAIARQSQCLLAFWDGANNQKPGGTAHIVDIYRTGIPPQRVIHDDMISNPECGPVIHINTRRSSLAAMASDQKLGSINFLPPIPMGRMPSQETGKAEQSRWGKVFECIDRFNSDVATLPEAQEAKPYGGYLVEDAGLASAWPPDDLKARRIARLFAVADARSSQTQEKRHGIFKQIILLAILAVFIEQLYSGPIASPLLLGVSIGWALVATWRYKSVVSQHLEDKYLDYRALAEATRVHFFWHLAGLADNPAEHYLRDQRDELEWLRQSIRTLDLPLQKCASIPDDKLGINISLNAWVKGQLSYFKRKSVENQTKADGLSRFAGGWFKGAVGVILFTLGFHFITEHFGIVLSEWMIPSLTVAYAFPFAVSGTIKIYESVMAYGEQANRYQKMAIYFDICESRIQRALNEHDLAAAQELLLAIGRQSLAENADWLLLHRQRPIEVPIGS